MCPYHHERVEADLKSASTKVEWGFESLPPYQGIIQSLLVLLDVKTRSHGPGFPKLLSETEMITIVGPPSGEPNR